jgi:NAD(P)-dependent dehydrogenase (short-subunit alcohol dehydrogenase family)
MKLPEELQFIANARMPQKTTDARMDGRICVLTGATSGVGYHAARHLAQGGAHIILVCRNTERASFVQNELKRDYNAQVEVVQADFSRLDDVRKAASDILKHYPRLDVLINNAGLHNTTRKLTESGIEMVFCVNHLASFLFTRLLLQRLAESAPARILQINSEGHRFGGLDLDDINWEKRKYKGLKGYGASKVAQLLTVWGFTDQLKGSGVTINAMHPGDVKTNIGMNNGWLYRLHKRLLITPLLKDPERSGSAIYYLVAAPEMAEVTGRFFHLTIDEKPAAHALDRSLGRRVWSLSEKLTGLLAEE